MSADTLASSSLNAFGLAGQVQPEEQIFVLTSAQLRAIISQATAPLEARIEALEERGVGSREGGEEGIRSLPGGQELQISTFQVVHSLQLENSALKRELEALHELRPWLEAISKKVSRLEAPKISPKTEARAEKIAKYLKERPDHKATFETLRGHLGADKRRLNEAIKLLMDNEPGRYGITRLQGDKRGRILILLPK